MHDDNKILNFTKEHEVHKPLGNPTRSSIARLNATKSAFVSRFNFPSEQRYLVNHRERERERYQSAIQRYDRREQDYRCLRVNKATKIKILSPFFLSSQRSSTYIFHLVININARSKHTLHDREIKKVFSKTIERGCASWVGELGGEACRCVLERTRHENAPIVSCANSRRKLPSVRRREIEPFQRETFSRRMVNGKRDIQFYV